MFPRQTSVIDFTQTSDELGLNYPYLQNNQLYYFIGRFRSPFSDHLRLGQFRSGTAFVWDISGLVAVFGRDNSVLGSLSSGTFLVWQPFSAGTIPSWDRFRREHFWSGSRFRQGQFRFKTVFIWDISGDSMSVARAPRQQEG